VRNKELRSQEDREEGSQKGDQEGAFQEKIAGPLNKRGASHFFLDNGGDFC
jgi:hypothetical protein